MGKIVRVEKDTEVKKSEAIIKARYKLSPLAIKFISVVISNLKRSDDINEEYVVKVKEFKELTGQRTKRIYELIDEALDDLLKNPITIPLGDAKNSILKANWVSGAIYNNGEIRFMIYPKLRPFLLEVKDKYLKYRIENILRLRSGYVIRLYEILKDWYNQSERYNGSKKVEKIVDVRWLREILELPNSYPYGGSSGLKIRVIEKAKKELADHTDLIFSYEEIKTGRKVTHLKFIIEENPKNAKEDDKASDYSFLKSKKAFISYLRKHYVNKPIVEAPNKNANGQMSKWSISQNGLIYDMYLTEENINATRSDEIYEKLYEFAKKNEQFKEKLANKE